MRAPNLFFTAGVASAPPSSRRICKKWDTPTWSRWTAGGEAGPKPVCRPSGTRTRQDSNQQIGWGGRIRTSTVLINSEVSYRLDHAPAADGVGSAASEIDGEEYF